MVAEPSDAFGDPGDREMSGGPPRRPRPVWLVLFAAAYVLAAGYAQLMAIVPGSGISIWPPSGLFVAALLLSPVPAWIWWIGAALAAEFAADALWFHNPVPVAMLISTGNTLEAVTGAWLIGRFCTRPVRLESLREVLALICLGAAVAPVLNATVSSAALAWFGMQSFVSAWPLFWIGDATGVLVFAPICLVVPGSRRELARLGLLRLGEATILAVIFIGVSVLTLSGALPFAFVIMPALLWAAVRFQVRGAAAALMVLALLTALFTAVGASQFAGFAESQQHTQVMLQLFLVISAITALIVAALARQHQQAVATLRSANRHLEARVVERTASMRASERRFAAVLEALPIGVALIDRTGRTVVGNAVYQRYAPALLPSAGIARVGDWEAHDDTGRLVEPHDFPAARALRGERVWPGEELLFKGDATRGPVWTRVAALPSRDAGGAIVGATVVIADADQEKRAIDALRESEARMRLVQQAAGVGTWEWDIVSGQARWSEENYRLHGLDPEVGPITYECWRAAVYPDDRALLRLAVEAAVAQREDVDTQYRVALPDGRVRWLVSRGHLVRDAEGRPERMLGISLDITARKEAEEQQALLAREVDHRAKNALAVVQSLVRLTRSERPAEFAKAIEGRIAALARAHTLLAHGRWTGGALLSLLEDELAAYLPTGRVALTGPPAMLKVDAVQPLSLCLHELATNAAKYGALSTSGGRVDVRWGLQGHSFLLVWTETGGPRIGAPPERSGFGSRLLEAAARGQLGGEAALEWRETGLVCRLRIAADRLHEPAGAATPKSAAMPTPDAGAGIVPAGLRALVAEDEPLLALDLARQLETLGIGVAAVVDSVEELQRTLERPELHLDLAVLDINLSGQPSFPLADLLLTRNVPVLFVTGYGELPGIYQTGHPRVRLLRKPLVPADLAQAIAALLAPGQARDAPRVERTRMAGT